MPPESGRWAGRFRREAGGGRNQSARSGLRIVHRPVVGQDRRHDGHTYFFCSPECQEKFGATHRCSCASPDRQGAPMRLSSLSQVGLILGQLEVLLEALARALEAAPWGWPWRPARPADARDQQGAGDHQGRGPGQQHLGEADDRRGDEREVAAQEQRDGDGEPLGGGADPLHRVAHLGLGEVISALTRSWASWAMRATSSGGGQPGDIGGTRHRARRGSALTTAVVPSFCRCSRESSACPPPHLFPATLWLTIGPGVIPEGPARHGGGNQGRERARAPGASAEGKPVSQLTAVAARVSPNVAGTKASEPSTRLPWSQSCRPLCPPGQTHRKPVVIVGQLARGVRRLLGVDRQHPQRARAIEAPLAPQILAQVPGERVDPGERPGRPRAPGWDRSGRRPPSTKPGAGAREMQVAIRCSLALTLSMASTTTSGSGASSLFGVFRRVELAAGLDDGVGIDGAQAFGHDLGLGLAERALHRVQLAVGVGHADAIEVDQDDAAKAAAGQRLGGERAHPAQTQHRRGGGRQAGQTLVAQQARRPVEPPVGPRARRSQRGGGGGTDCAWRPGSLAARPGRGRYRGAWRCAVVSAGHLGGGRPGPRPGRR